MELDKSPARSVRRCRTSGVVRPLLQRTGAGEAAPATVAERGASSPRHLLTEREQAVLAELAAGRSNAAIAERLFLSAKTVEKHVGAIFLKLGLTEDATANRRVLAVLAWLRGAC